MQRNSNLNKILINRFVIFVLCFIVFTYYIFVFQCMPSLMDKYPVFVDFFLIVFHFSFIMMVWSLLTAMFTEPGKVPLYWVGLLFKNINHIIKFIRGSFWMNLTRRKRDFVWFVIFLSQNDAITARLAINVF